MLHQPALRARRPGPPLAALVAALVTATTLCACSPAGSPAPAATFPPGTTGVVIDALAYTPKGLVVDAGTTVAWANEEAAAHDVKADDGSFAGPMLQQGEVWTWTFASAGTWTYHCTVHPEMSGTVTVR